uniref:Uncharacterized protein n=1 Tax=Arundo donax TaxID=35708 RepID=A0A0A8YE03_ARUDO
MTLHILECMGKKY